MVYVEEGYIYGRFSELLNSRGWKELSVKRAQCTERFLKTFNMLAQVDAHKSIKFDWKWVVRHLCTPPYDRGPWKTELENSVEPKSCRTVINEIYRQGNTSPSLLEAMARFEQVAMELNV